MTKKDHKYEYDANGNLVYVNTERPKKDGTQMPKSTERKLLWDEENRLEAIDDNGFVSNYWYDAAGERTVKTSGESQQMYVNSVFSGGDTQTANFTAYVNPYLVVSKGGSYTKHIYIGSQRIVSKLGDLDSYGSDPRRIEYAGANVDGAKVDYKGKYTALQQTIKDRYGKFEVEYLGKDNDDYVNGQGFCCDDSKTLKSFAANDNPELFQYYYHSDHLGSSSLITNLDGEIVQHIEYVPFGEVFIEERNNTWNTPYLFNAKELDEETGLYYYGARYYDPRVSIWLSVDPMWEKYPSISAYAYCAQNPVKLVDPNGKDLVITGEQIKTTFNALHKSYNKGLTLTFDSNTNFVYATRNEGVELSHDEEVLYNIITSRNIEVRLETYKNDVTSDGHYIAFGGAFLGNTLFQDGTNQTKAVARQAVCVPEMEMGEKAYGQSGVLYLHEISEAFEGARNSLASGIAARPALTDAEKNDPNSDYNRAHRAATPQPFIEQNPNTGDFYIEYKKRGVNANGRTDNRIMNYLKNKPTPESYFKSIIKPIKFK